MSGGTIAGGDGVIHLEVRDLAHCTGFLLNPYMIVTAAHCVYSGQPTGTKGVKVRATDDGRNWRCISGSGSGGNCSGWKTVSYRAWSVNPPSQPDPANDFAVIYSSTPFNDNHSVGIAPDFLWVADNYDVWGRGSSSQMRHAEGMVDSVARRVFMDDYDGQVTLCEGDSGGPAFPFNPTYDRYVKYAAGIAVVIQPPAGKDRKGTCAASGETMVYHHFGMFTVDRINGVVENDLGTDVCPHCTCKDLGVIYPGSGLDGYFACNAV